MYLKKIYKDKTVILKNGIEIDLNNSASKDYQDFFAYASANTIPEEIVALKTFAAIKNNAIEYIYEDHEEYPLPLGIDSKIIVPENLDPNFLALDQNGDLYQREKTEEELLQEIEATHALNISKGQAIVKRVLALNDFRQASDAIKIQFLARPEVKQTRELLELGRLSLAKAVIQEVVPDAEVITSDIRQKVLNLLADY